MWHYCVFLLIFLQILPFTSTTSEYAITKSWAPTYAPTHFTGQVSSTEYNALYSFYNATNGTFWHCNTSSVSTTPNIGNLWDFDNHSTADPCQDEWEGIVCQCPTAEICTIVNLILYQCNLTGTIPEEIGDLTNLTQLTLADNAITGTLPTSITKLINLLNFDVQNNLIGGKIPENIGDWRHLENFEVALNLFTGSLPYSLFTITSLRALNLDYNDFRGTIPNIVGNLTYLEELLLIDNNVKGTLPKSITNITALRRLQLRYNGFSGKMYDEFAWMNMTLFDIGHNYFTGTVPAFGKYENVSKYLIVLHLDTNLFTGTMPATFGNLSAVDSLYLYHNMFHGTLPASFGNLTALHSLNIQGNLLTGSLPSSFLNMRTIRIYSVANNFFEGSSEVLFKDKRNLITVITQNNYFTGTLPIVQIYPLTTVMMLGQNMYHGTIPDNLLYSTLMLIFGLNDNLLSGNIPTWVSDWVVKSYFNVGNNVLTGSIPKELFNNSYNLAELILSDNQLTGTIPSNIGYCRQLLQLELSNNKLSGTLPNGFWTLMDIQSVSIDQNRFHGDLSTVENLQNFHSLTNFDFSENSFSGSFPLVLFQLPKIQNILASSNCFYGELTTDICGSETLVNVVMDGLSTATSCQTRLFPGFPYFTAFHAKNPMYGSIPLCLFSSPLIEAVYLSGNNFEGNIENHINISHSLQKLSLAHNRLTGTIPLAFQEHPWITLDLSYNKFHGALSPDISTVPLNGSLHLEVNRLSGEIPAVLKTANTISVLEGNLFSCDVSRSDLPTNDPQSDIYACGSDIINYSIYSWLAILGVFFICSVIVGVQIMLINKQTHFHVLSLYYLAIQFYQILHQKLEEQLQDTSYPQKHHVYPLNIFHQLLTSIRHLFLYFTVFVLLCLMPIYTIISNLYGAYDHSYAWQISSIYVSGQIAGIVYCTLFTLTILFFTYLYLNKVVALYFSQKDYFYQEGIKLKKRKITFLDGTTSAIIGLFNFAVMVLIDVVYVIAVVKEDGQTIAIIQVLLSAFKLGWNEVGLWRFYPILKRVLLKWMKKEQAAEIDAFVAANDDIDDDDEDDAAARRREEDDDEEGEEMKEIKRKRTQSKDRSISTLHSSPKTTEGRKRFGSAESLMPSFPLDLSPGKLFGGGGRSDDKPRPPSEISERASIMNDHDLGYSFSRFEVSFLVFTVIMNNIIIPCIAIAIVSTDCYHNAFFSNPPSEQTSQTTCILTANIGTNEKCLDDQYATTTETTTYNTAFMYRYQCSAAFVVNFAAVHIFMFVLVGIIVPVGKLLLKAIYDASTRGSFMHKAVSRILPRYLKELSAVPPKRRVVIFDKDRMVVKLSAYLSIVLSFGVLFPPLSIIACLSVYIMTYFEEYMISRMLSYAKKAKYGWYRPHLERECDRIVHSWYGILWLLMPFAAFSYAYVVLDTIGDVYGWRSALGPFLFILLLPWFILIWRRAANKLHLPMIFPNRYAKDMEDRTFSDNRYVRSVSMAVTSVVKPLNHLTFSQKEIEEGNQSDADIYNEIHAIRNGYRPTDVWRYFDPHRNPMIISKPDAGRDSTRITSASLSTRPTSSDHSVANSTSSSASLPSSISMTSSSTNSSIVIPSTVLHTVPAGSVKPIGKHESTKETAVTSPIKAVEVELESISKEAAQAGEDKVKHSPEDSSNTEAVIEEEEDHQEQTKHVEHAEEEDDDDEISLDDIYAKQSQFSSRL